MNKKNPICFVSIAIIISLVLLIAYLPQHYTIKYYTIIIEERIGIEDRIGNEPILESTTYAYKNGVLVASVHNAMTTAGKNGINQRLFSAMTTNQSMYIAIGVGSGGTTALNSEQQRAQATYSEPAADQWQLAFTFSFASSYTITEGGVLNQTTTGTMTFYVDTLNVGVTSADTLQIIWKGTTSGS